MSSLQPEDQIGGGLRTICKCYMTSSTLRAETRGNSELGRCFLTPAGVSRPPPIAMVARCFEIAFGASTSSVLRKGVFARSPGRCRAAGRADHIDEGAHRGRHLPVPGLIEAQSLE